MVKAKESLLDYYVPAGHGDMSAKISQILNMRDGFYKALVAFDKNQFQINTAIKWFNTTELSIMQPENLSHCTKLWYYFPYNFDKWVCIVSWRYVSNVGNAPNCT